MNITMTPYAKFKDFNILYDTTLKQYFIASKDDTEGRPSIGGFEFAANAIDFAVKRVS